MLNNNLKSGLNNVFNLIFSEYEKFQKCLMKKYSPGKDLYFTLQTSESLLTDSMKKEINSFIERLVSKRRIYLNN